MNYEKEIKELFNSTITSYQIAKDCGLTPQFIDNYRKKDSKIENMALGKAEMLANYSLKQQGKAAPTAQEVLDFLKNHNGNIQLVIVSPNSKIYANSETSNLMDIYKLTKNDGHSFYGVYGDIAGWLGEVHSDRDSDEDILKAIQKALDMGTLIDRRLVEKLKPEDETFYWGPLQ